MSALAALTLRPLCCCWCRHVRTWRTDRVIVSTGSCPHRAPRYMGYIVVGSPTFGMLFPLRHPTLQNTKSKLKKKHTKYTILHRPVPGKECARAAWPTFWVKARRAFCIYDMSSCVRTSKTKTAAKIWTSPTSRTKTDRGNILHSNYSLNWSLMPQDGRNRICAPTHHLDGPNH